LNSVSFQEKIYLVVSAGFYVFSIYQNILVCYRFHDNMKKIHSYFKDFKHYLNYTIESMKNYNKHNEQLSTHNEFNKIVNDKMIVLNEIKCKLDMVTEFKYDIKKLTEIGHILKTFYEIYNNKIYEEAIMYSFGFNGYIDCILGLQENIKEGKISFAQFTKDSKHNERNNERNNKSKNKNKNKNIFKKSYYACLKDKKHVKNTIKLIISIKINSLKEYA
jgi:hypothetical protein